MGFWKVTAKILTMILSVALAAAPFVVEYIRFKRDKKNKISHKRLRVVIYTIFYLLITTFVLCLLNDALFKAKDTSFIRWLVKQLSIDARAEYTGKVFATIYTNFLIGLWFVLANKFVRVGLKEKNLLVPQKANGEFSLFQKIERSIIRFFNTETWFFVGDILKYFNIVISSVYVLVFLAYQLPAMFGADWIPYVQITKLFDAGYLYPVLSLLSLWEFYFFLQGVKLLEFECPEILGNSEDETAKISVSLEAIDAEVKKQFKDFYVCDVELSKTVGEELSATEHKEITKYIQRAIENDSRNPGACQEVYLNCVDKLVEAEKCLLINGSFFSEFSKYFLRYLSITIARGDNVVFVCNDDRQIDDVYQYLEDGLAQLSSLYCKDFKADAVDFDNPIWKIVKINGAGSVIEGAAVSEASVLVTSLNYLCSKEFEDKHGAFIHLLDTVVLVHGLDTVNTFNRQLTMLDTRLKQLSKHNAMLSKNSEKNPEFAVRYMSKDVRYVCFDDTRSPGFDKVLKNMLAVDFESVDIMSYAPTTLVRCYNYEAAKDENGQCVCPQFLDTEEKIDAVMNMAVLCLEKGAESVDVFVNGEIPYADMAESMASNIAQVTVDANCDRIRVNNHRYNSEGYRVVIVMDAGDNLPATLRRYISMVSGAPALVMVFSRPYLLRDYYYGDIASCWRSHQLIRIPVEEGTKKDVVQKILVKANAGGISEDEILRLAAGVPQFAEYAKKGDVNGILRNVLEIYGLSQEDRVDLYRFFEYESFRDFDENGVYSREDRVILRKNSKLYEHLSGRDVVVMVNGDTEVQLPVPRRRLSQHFIKDQNLVFEGNVYHIHEVDTEAGRLYVRLAVGGKNEEPYQYVQKREYRLEFTEDAETVFATKHVVLNGKEEGVEVKDVFISGLRVPMEVLTRGYFIVDPQHPVKNAQECRYVSISDEGNDLLAKQTYRRYGELTKPVYSSETILKETKLVADDKGAQVMVIRLTGQFGADVNKVAALGGIILNELLGAMFPSVAEELVVCPVIRGELTGENAASAMAFQPKLFVEGGHELLPEGDLEFLIIEDSNTDLGVISVLMSAGDDVLKTLFAPVHSYLSWYTAAENKSDYVYGGLEKEPDCFDFLGLQKLAKILGDSTQKIQFVEIDAVVEYDECDFCGKRYKKEGGFTELVDGRIMCNGCAAKAVANDRKIWQDHISRAKIFLESAYGIAIDATEQISFDTTLKIVNALKQNTDIRRKNFDIPLKSYIDTKGMVHVEYTVPSVNLTELLVRELTYGWQMKHIPNMAPELAEGHMALVAIQYLRFLNENALAADRVRYYESTANLSGEGYRRLVRELLENQRFCNNPFLFLSDMYAKDEETAICQTLSVTEDAEFGRPYTPKTPDRAMDGNIAYFYRSRLSGAKLAAYDALLDCLLHHTASVTIADCSFDDLRIVADAIRYDRPELFWFSTLSVCGAEVTPLYCATAEEAAAIQAKIDEVVPKFLEGITDSMSAYDVALRVHDRVMRFVDYDTVALMEEEKKGVSDESIDYIRTICGVFLNGKAVCEGYARAVQYLLQKCGIECAEVPGHVVKDNGDLGEGHGWNILKIDGDYYYMDATWDDNSNTIQTVKRTDTGFDHFCITTQELLTTRVIDLSPVEMPECTATRANYFYHNDLVLADYDLSKITEIAKQAAEKGRKSFAFKCKTSALYNQVMQKLITVGDDCYEVLRAVAKIDKNIQSTQYSYAYDKNIRTITVKFKYV